MKIKHLLSTAFVLFLLSCEKSDEAADSVSTAMINGNAFSPSAITAKKSPDNLYFVFEDGDQAIEILTNDVVPGTYEVTAELLKSGDLKANMKFVHGDETYDGVSGLVSINVDGGAFYGSYEAELKSADGISVTISSGTFSGIEAGEGNLILSEKAIREELDKAYTDLANYIQFEYRFDAVYANRVQLPAAGWSSIYGHSQTPDDAYVSRLWNEAFDLVYRVNLVLESAEQVISDEESKKQLQAEGFAIRAYLYLKLMKWFGPVPVVDEPAAVLPARNPVEDVFQWILYNADFAIALLPESWPETSGTRMTKSFARGVKARTALIYESYEIANVTAMENLDSGYHSLSDSNGNFQSDNPEIYWGFAKGEDQEFNELFNKGDYVPALRHTETYLSAATSGFLTGAVNDALGYINAVRERRNDESLSTIGLADIYQEFNTELYLEGESFFLMKLFNMVDEELQLEAYRHVLPIPTDVLAANPEINQNEGY